jgi:hypothetical protein
MYWDRIYTWAYFFSKPGSFVGRRDIEGNVEARLRMSCRLLPGALSAWNAVTLLRVRCQCGIQCDEGAAALFGGGGTELSTPQARSSSVAQCVGMLEVKEPLRTLGCRNTEGLLI